MVSMFLFCCCCYWFVVTNKYINCELFFVLLGYLFNLFVCIIYFCEITALSPFSSQNPPHPLLSPFPPQAFHCPIALPSNLALFLSPIPPLPPSLTFVSLSLSSFSHVSFPSPPPAVNLVVFWSTCNLWTLWHTSVTLEPETLSSYLWSSEPEAFSDPRNLKSLEHTGNLQTWNFQYKPVVPRTWNVQHKPGTWNIQYQAIDDPQNLAPKTFSQWSSEPEPLTAPPPNPWTESLQYIQ